MVQGRAIRTMADQ